MPFLVHSLINGRVVRFLCVCARAREGGEHSWKCPDQSPKSVFSLVKNQHVNIKKKKRARRSWMMDQFSEGRATPCILRCDVASPADNPTKSAAPSHRKKYIISSHPAPQLTKSAPILFSSKRSTYVIQSSGQSSHPRELFHTCCYTSTTTCAFRRHQRPPDRLLVELKQASHCPCFFASRSMWTLWCHRWS
jgi:hypothetical protein